jgi:argininosuccinate lyase
MAARDTGRRARADTAHIGRSQNRGLAEMLLTAFNRHLMPAIAQGDALPKKKLWGGRFTSEEDPLFKEFNDSLGFDHKLLEADIWGSIAYARGLERAGVFSRKERTCVESGLRKILEKHKSDPQLVKQSQAEDVHSFVEEALEKYVGPLALKLHTGRSRNDQVATDLRLYIREQEVVLECELNRLLKTLAGLADKNLDTIMPGYTHLQRAQPVLFSHYILAYGEMLLRDRARLREVRKRMNVCPLGAGALSGTVYNVDREALARDLEFAAATGNSMDAVSDRDFALDFLYCASMAMMHLSRLAEDLILYSSAEFGFVQLGDSVASGSSLMPQKKNPDALELIRGKTGRVYGHLLSLLTVMKGLPLTYNKDLQEDKEGLFDTVQSVILCVRMADKVLSNIQVFPERMREACAAGYLDATELADYLVAGKMPFREAHHLIGKIVVRASELKLPLAKLPLREYQSFSPLFRGDLFGCLDLQRIVGRRNSPGGTAPAAVRRALQLFRKRIAR